MKERWSDPVFLALGREAVGPDHETVRVHLARVCGSALIMPAHVEEGARARLVSRGHAALWSGAHAALSPSSNAILKSRKAKLVTSLWLSIRDAGLMTVPLAQLATLSSTIWQFVSGEEVRPDHEAKRHAPLRVKRIAWSSPPDPAIADVTGVVQPSERLADGIDLQALLKPIGSIRIGLVGCSSDEALAALRVILPCLSARAKCTVVLIGVDPASFKPLKSAIAAQAREGQTREGKSRVSVKIASANDLRPAMEEAWDFLIGGHGFAPQARPFKSLQARFFLLAARRLIGRIAWNPVQSDTLRLMVDPSTEATQGWHCYLNEGAPGALVEITPADFRHQPIGGAAPDAGDPLVDLVTACHELQAMRSRSAMIRWIYGSGGKATQHVSEAVLGSLFQAYALNGPIAERPIDSGLYVETALALLDWLHESPVNDLREMAYRRFLGRPYDGTDRTPLDDSYPMADRIKFLRNIVQSPACLAQLGVWDHHVFRGTLMRLSAYFDARSLYDDAKIGRYIRYKKLDRPEDFAADIVLDDLVLASCRRYSERQSEPAS